MPQKNDVALAAGVLGCTILGFLAFKYPDRAIFDEERQGIARLKGIPIFGTFFSQLSAADHFYDAQVDGFESLNALTMICSTIGTPPRVTTIDPSNMEYILKTNFPNYIKGEFMQSKLGKLFGHGIFVSNGESWKLQRKITSRIFNVANLRDQFSSVFIDLLRVISEQVLDRSVGHVVDFQDVMFRFTLDAFVQIGFDTQLGGSINAGSVGFAESFDICQRNCEKRFRNPFTSLIDALGPLLHPRTKSMKQHYDTVNTFAYEMLEKRRREIKEGKQFKDLLSHFMEARDATNNFLGDKELRDVILNLIIAGRDTTASTISWTLYCLLTHPHAEDKFLEEINERLPNHDLTPTEYYESVKDMTYSHAILYEAMRLYPAVAFNSKTALEDDVWPDGTHIKKDDIICWCPYAQARSTKVWGDDAKEFNPERWIADDGQMIRESQAKWPVFSVGPRVCIGQSLATLQALITLTTLLRRYKFSLVPNQKIEYLVSLTMPMKNGLKVFVEKRY